MTRIMNTEFISFHSLDMPRYMAPSGWAEHVPFAFDLVSKLKPKLIVELGVFQGMSYFSFCQAVQTNNLSSACYGVDSWYGDEHASFYTEEVFEKVNTYNNANYSEFSTLLRCDFEEALKHFKDKTIDLLHIDGLHTYEAVKNDFETWLPKMSDSSIVLFHDTAEKERGFGVYRLWEELSALYPSFSFEHGHGLGVLATGKNVSPELLPLFQNTETTLSEIRTIYHRLGMTFTAMLNAEDERLKAEELQAARARILQLQDEVEELGAWGKRSNEELDNIRTGFQQLERHLAHANHAAFLKETELEVLRQEMSGPRPIHPVMDKLIEELANLNRQVADLSVQNLSAQLSAQLPSQNKTTSPLINTEVETSISSLKKQIEDLQNTILWYKKTYEERSFLGVIKQKIDSKFSK